MILPPLHTPLLKVPVALVEGQVFVQRVQEVRVGVEVEHGFLSTARQLPQLPHCLLLVQVLVCVPLSLQLLVHDLLFCCPLTQGHGFWSATLQLPNEPFLQVLVPLAPQLLVHDIVVPLVQVGGGLSHGFLFTALQLPQFPHTPLVQVLVRVPLSPQLLVHAPLPIVPL